jgi:hypothetical protein
MNCQRCRELCRALGVTTCAPTACGRSTCRAGSDTIGRFQSADPWPDHVPVPSFWAAPTAAARYSDVLEC